MKFTDVAKTQDTVVPRVPNIKAVGKGGAVDHHGSGIENGSSAGLVLFGLPETGIGNPDTRPVGRLVGLSQNTVGPKISRDAANRQGGGRLVNNRGLGNTGRVGGEGRKGRVRESRGRGNRRRVR